MWVTQPHQSMTSPSNTWHHLSGVPLPAQEHADIPAAETPSHVTQQGLQHAQQPPSNTTPCSWRQHQHLWQQWPAKCSPEPTCTTTCSRYQHHKCPIGHRVHATAAQPQQHYQQLLLQQIQQLRNHLASQQASGATAGFAPSSAMDDAASNIQAEAMLEQQDEQLCLQGCQQEQLHCSQAAIDHNKQHHQPLQSQHQQDHEDQQQAETLTELVGFSPGGAAGTGGSCTVHVSTTKGGGSGRKPVALRRRRLLGSPGVTRALFGSPAAKVPSSVGSAISRSSTAAGIVYSTSRTSAKHVAAGCPEPTQQQQEGQLETHASTQQQRGESGTDAIAPTPSQRPPDVSEVLSHGATADHTSSSSCGSVSLEDSCRAVPAAAAAPDATPVSADAVARSLTHSIVDASPARVQCLVDKLEQRLSALQNLLHSPAADTDENQQTHLQLELLQQQRQEEQHPGMLADISNTSNLIAEPGSGLATGDSSNDKVDAATQTPRKRSNVVGRPCISSSATQHVPAQGPKGPSSSKVLHTKIVHSIPGTCAAAGAQDSQHICSSGSHADISSNASDQMAAAVSKCPAIYDKQLQHCVQDTYRTHTYSAELDSVHKLSHVQRVTSPKQQQTQQVRQHSSQLRHVDLSYGGAALLKSNMCSDKLMFALLLASKRPAKD